jgi:hypothetical protein
MTYILRFVQQFGPGDADAYLELEKQFKELERVNTSFPKGKRYRPVAGPEPSNTVVWESEFDSLQAIEAALQVIADDPTHTDLYGKQSKYITGARTEIFKLLDL